MTVAELRRLLADLPDDMPIAVEEYEGGITAESVHPRVVSTKVGHKSPMVGELEEFNDFDRGWDNDLSHRPDGPKVFLLSRRSEFE